MERREKRRQMKNDGADKKQKKKLAKVIRAPSHINLQKLLKEITRRLAGTRCLGCYHWHGDGTGAVSVPPCWGVVQEGRRAKLNEVNVS